MLSGRVTHTTLRALDWLAKHTLSEPSGPEHQHTGRRGEEDAYFHLRRLGYVMVARNYRTPLRRGEIDLIGWEKNVLCFIEVKTRTTHAVKPAEAAVDRDKQRALTRVARDYMRNMGGGHSLRDVPTHEASGASKLQFRFDVVTVYYDLQCSSPQFELFRNAFPVA